MFSKNYQEKEMSSISGSQVKLLLNTHTHPKDTESKNKKGIYSKVCQISPGPLLSTALLYIHS